MDFKQTLGEHIDGFQRLADIAETIVAAGTHLAAALQKGNKILICGNGGSAADSQHFAAEIVGRFARERDAWPAIALTTDTSVLTALANDYSFSDVFARQIEAIGREGDILVGLSTSGNSENVIRAAGAARRMRIRTIALLGEKGGKLAALADTVIRVPVVRTARVQEAHAFVLHFWAETIENTLCGGKECS